jgi:hypothetical protein
MFGKKSVALAALVALILIGAPVAANAATPFAPQAGHPKPIFQDDEREDEREDEDEDEKNHEYEAHENIPPVFVVPGSKKDHHKRPPKPNERFVNVLPAVPELVIPNTTGSNASVQPLPETPVTESEYLVVASNDPAAEKALGTSNPNESQPIDVSMIRADLKNPSDQFLESAYLGLAVLGVAAVGLGSVAGVRAIRVRRSGKSDYFYDNE